MLEKLPDVLGHVLRGQRAGLDEIAFHAIGLRAGMGAIRVQSLAIVDHGPIPVSYTADGEGLSPPLTWSDVPSGAPSLVLLVEDADAPAPHPLVHAIVVDLPAGDGGLAEGALDSPGHDGLSELHAGRHSFLRSGSLRPDPPPGHGVHRYAFQVFPPAARPNGPRRPAATTCSRRCASTRSRAVASSAPTSALTAPSAKGPPSLSPIPSPSCHPWPRPDVEETRLGARG
jgi:phosphatidylethanolamine-binding protein (PEBP) family uncharacterized protein